jgi:predicted GTPase
VDVKTRNTVLLGAAGRDFHNFNVAFRNDPTRRVVAFTAAQIPGIDGRRYPAALAGPLYPDGIPIYAEAELPHLLRDLDVDEVVFAYSDVTDGEVMELASVAGAGGADFRLLGPRSTMLVTTKPVVSVCAVRTGCGKSQTARVLADVLAKRGKRVAVVRHPMPYGNLVEQRCQRFETVADLDRHKCTIEEREEYELHLEQGHLLFAGVDYEEILREAEKEADILLWDGGNNDLPFFQPSLHIVLVDPHRAGDELRYYPSQTNVRLADVCVVAKSGTASVEGIRTVKRNIERLKPDAAVVDADSIVTVAEPEKVRDRRVLVIEDGPTLTHGGMAYGAGTVAAKRYGARELADPRPHAVGSLKETFAKYSHLGAVLPAMGYGSRQIEELAQTIAATPCDIVLAGTPVDLTRVLPPVRPIVRVRYELDAGARERLEGIIDRWLARRSS